MNHTFIKNFRIFFPLILSSFIVINNAACSMKPTLDEDGFVIIERDNKKPVAETRTVAANFFDNNLDLKDAVVLGFNAILGKIDTISEQIRQLEIRGKNELAQQLAEQRQALIKILTENFQRELTKQKEAITTQLTQQHEEVTKQLNEQHQATLQQHQTTQARLEEAIKKMQSYTYALPFKMVAPLLPLVLDSFLPIPKTLSLVAVIGLYYLAYRQKTNKFVSFARRVASKLCWSRPPGLSKTIINKLCWNKAQAQNNVQ